MKKIMIVAGEASGDVHGANLVRAMLKKDSNLNFSGMGGKELASAGVSILFDAKRVSVVGLIEIFSHLSDILAALKTLKKYIKNEKPDLLIVIDFPDFNLMLAKYAKKHGVKVFYYITPQVWAWREGRVKTISKRSDGIGVILPFEQQFFESRGVAARYTGHPLLDSVKPAYGREHFIKKHSLEIDPLIIGIIPGSRRKEIEMLLPIFLKSCEILANKINKKVCFVIPKASTISRDILNENGLDTFAQKFDVVLSSTEQHEAMSSCDAVIAASGTVTLELALLDVPMVVAYKASKLTYLIGQKIVKIDNFSLVNLIADKPFITELLQDEVTPSNISEELLAIVTVEKRKQIIHTGLKEVRGKLGSEGASECAARMAFEIINR